MTHRCLIIEDDLYTANDIKTTIQEHFNNIECLDAVDNIVDAKLAIDQHKPDLVISDINLKGDNVFTLFRQFSTFSFKIIFITSYSKFAVEAFKFSALDFLEKPFTDDDLISAIKNGVSVIDLENYNKQIQTFFHNFNPNQQKKKLVLKNLEAVHIVSIEDIVYVKSDNNYSEFYINDNRKIIISKHLKFFETQLHPYSFFRTNQSYLVNLNFAKTFRKKDSILELIGSQQIPVSMNKVGALLNNLNTLS